MHKNLQELGISPGYGFRKLLFCAQASILVVQAQPTGGWRPDRLFARPVSGERYQPLGAPAEMVSQEDPVLSPSHPLLAYNTELHSFRLDEEGNEQHFGNWKAIRVLDLSTGSETHVVDRETLHLPDSETEVWVSRLLSFAERAETVHIVAAVRRRDAYTVDYYVSELHLSSSLIRPLAHLPAVFL